MTSDDFVRRGYGPGRFNLPRDELEAAMRHIRQAVVEKPDGKRFFVVLHGPPGAGKSWLLEQIRERCEEVGARCTEIVQAEELLDDPEARLIELLRFCLDDPAATVAGAQPHEIVQELSNRLDSVLRYQSEPPVALFFDDLDHWINWDLDDPHLQRIYRQLWWALLRHTHLPGLVICASREPLPAARFSPALKRKLQLIRVSSLDDRIEKLADGIADELAARPSNPATIDKQQLRSLAFRYACGHPLVVDWLAWKLNQDGQAFDDTVREGSLRELAGVLIGGRLDKPGADGQPDKSDEELLIHLARHFPEGFTDEHPELGNNGPSLVRRLKQIGLVDLIPGTPTYRVLPPLSCLYKEVGSNG